MSGDTLTPDLPAGQLAGYFGKMPARGDFVSGSLGREFVDPWDDWIQASIEQSRDRLGEQWLDVYLTSPLWCFALSPSICGNHAWGGVLMPSVDAVGRYFPLTIAAPLSPETNIVTLPAAAAVIALTPPGPSGAAYAQRYPGRRTEPRGVAAAGAGQRAADAGDAELLARIATDPELRERSAITRDQRNEWLLHRPLAERLELWPVDFWHAIDLARPSDEDLAQSSDEAMANAFVVAGEGEGTGALTLAASNNMDAQAIAETLLLDAQIDLGELYLSRQRRQRLRVRERGTEQVGQVFDDLFGEIRVDAGQAGDGVHAVEQEVRPDQCLQRADARLRLEDDAAAPLARHVQVAHGEGDEDRTRRHGAQQEVGVRVVDDGKGADSRRDLPGEFGKDQAQQFEDEKSDDEGAVLAHPFEPAAQLAHDRGAEQCQPEYEERDFRQPVGYLRHGEIAIEHQAYALDQRRDRLVVTGRGARADARA